MDARSSSESNKKGRIQMKETNGTYNDKEIVAGELRELIKILNDEGIDEKEMQRQVKEITDVLTPIANKSLNQEWYKDAV